MRRYWVEASDRQGDAFVVSGESYHHIVDVCRQEVGSKFELLTEEGKAYFVNIELLNKKNFLARILEERTIKPLPRPHLHLALCLPKFATLELIIEKSVELGVKSVQPLFSDYSFVRSQQKLSDNKEARWEKIVRSATQQSGRGDLMQIQPALGLDRFLETHFSAETESRNSEQDSEHSKTLGVFAYEGASQISLRKYLHQHDPDQEGHKNGTQDVWIFVGSEGGFSTREVELFHKFNLEPVTLGQQVLRVETACLALISILKYEFDIMMPE